MLNQITQLIHNLSQEKVDKLLEDITGQFSIFSYHYHTFSNDTIDDDLNKYITHDDSSFNFHNQVKIIDLDRYNNYYGRYFTIFLSHPTIKTLSFTLRSIDGDLFILGNYETYKGELISLPLLFCTLGIKINDIGETIFCFNADKRDDAYRSWKTTDNDGKKISFLDYLEVTLAIEKGKTDLKLRNTDTSYGSEAYMSFVKLMVNKYLELNHQWMTDYYTCLANMFITIVNLPNDNYGVIVIGLNDEDELTLEVNLCNDKDQLLSIPPLPTDNHWTFNSFANPDEIIDREEYDKHFGKVFPFITNRSKHISMDYLKETYQTILNITKKYPMDKKTKTNRSSQYSYYKYLSSLIAEALLTNNYRG